MCRGMLHTPSILDLISDVFRGVSNGEESANGRQMRQIPRGKSSSMVAPVGEGGGAARSAARSVVVMRGLLGASAALPVFSWVLILPRFLLDASRSFSHDFGVLRSHPPPATPLWRARQTYALPFPPFALPLPASWLIVFPVPGSLLTSLCVCSVSSDTSPIAALFLILRFPPPFCLFLYLLLADPSSPQTPLPPP